MFLPETNGQNKFCDTDDQQLQTDEPELNASPPMTSTNTTSQKHQKENEVPNVEDGKLT